MTRVPNRGTPYAHPIFRKISPPEDDWLSQEAAEYFRANPRVVEILEWIVENLDAEFQPKGLRIRWWGVEPLDDDGRHVPMSLYRRDTKITSRDDDAALERAFAFREQLEAAFPEVNSLMRVFI